MKSKLNKDYFEKINQIKMIEFEDIKSAMRYINNSERDLTVRKTKIYDTKTNELIAIIKIKK